MKRTGTATWQGALKDGKGINSTQSGTLDKTPYSFKSRFEDESGRSGTNPEELIAAAHAGCFTMQLAHMLAEAGHPADMLETVAEVSVEQQGGGFAITTSKLKLAGTVPGISSGDFDRIANEAKAGCPVSKALAGVDITLEATLG